MNWGDNLTVVGAIRRDGWGVLKTKWRPMTKVAFIEWRQRRWVPRLRDGNIVHLDNLQAHKAPEARSLIEARGAAIKPLPAVRRGARAARPVGTPSHYRQSFAQAGYGHASENRD